MAKEETLGIKAEQKIDSVEDFKFEPIKGHPMLNWKGKRPFTSTQFFPAQLKEQHGEEVNGWINKVFWGDNLQVMSHLLKTYRGQVDLIYIDPPYDSKADYKRKISLKGKNLNNDFTSFEEKQYSDIWSNDNYLQFMYERLIMMRELMSQSGIIILHCDWHKGHHLRCILDEVFGQDMFKNEVIWYYYNKMQGNVNYFARNHDNLLIYSKSNDYTFNTIRVPREEPIKQIKRVWSSELQKLVNAKDENGKVIYLESTHKTVDDVWRLSMLQPADKKENLFYPTQKPESLITRCINAFSNPGDLVFDCFMGSGTTQAVAMKLGRKFIGADINLGAIQTTSKRLINVAKVQQKNPFELEFESDGGNKKGVYFYTGFQVYNVNHYDVFRNPVQAKELLIKALEIQPLPQNIIFDGEKDGRMVKIMPVNRIATRADLNELVTGFDYKVFEKRNDENPGKAVEYITLVCMGHEPDLAAILQKQMPYKLDIEVVDILRDKSNLEFKRDSEAEISAEDGKLVVQQFYPMNLLQKLSIMKESVEDWKELTESIMIDFNYDGAVFEPQVVDVPPKDELVKGQYIIPNDAGTIRVKITDLLSESLEITLNH